MAKRTNRVAWGLAGVLAVVVLGGVGLLGIRWIFHLQPEHFDREFHEQVVAAVANGTLRPDAAGEVVLPTRYASTSITGWLYVNHSARGLTLILFPIMCGHANTEGYLYCSRPLTPADPLGWDSYSGKKTIKLHYDLDPPWLRSLPRSVPSPAHDVDLCQRLDAHWYRIEDPFSD